MRPTRRSLLAAAGALAAAPALAAPSASDVRLWTAYESRLRARLADAGGGGFDAAARAALDLSNRARRAAGVRELVWHEDLALTARAHAADLARRAYVEHLTPEGFDPSHRFWLLARRTIGSPSENIAYHRGPQAVGVAHLVQLWRRSPRHWSNVLRPTHTHAGFGLVRRGDRNYLVGLYARPLAELSEPVPFRATQTDLARAFREIPAELRPSLAVPQGAALGKVEGSPPVMQIAAARRLQGRGYELIGGPIFLAAEA